MKIIKMPKFKKVICSCGCVYEIDRSSDITMAVVFNEPYRYTTCPFCGIKYDVEYEDEDEKEN